MLKQESSGKDSGFSSRQTGVLGEKIALEYLRNKGFQVLDKNYIPKFIAGPQKGEIDIIARKSGVFHFVEVKTLRLRKTEERGPEPVEGRFPSCSAQGELFRPEDKVNFSKQKKIRKTAEFWLMENKISLESGWQIDVVAIRIDPDLKKAKINFFENIVV